MRHVLALLLGLAIAGPAVAADETSRPGLAQQVAGATVRAEIWTGHLNEQHIWRFRADGTVTGDMWAVEAGWRSSRHIEINDRGTWRVEAGRLCVSWRRFGAGTPQCYSVTPARAGWWRFSSQSGGPSFLGQVSRN